MSHWRSGLPKLDIEPFDAQPLYQAVKVTVAQGEVQAARRRLWLVPVVILVGLALVTATVIGILALMG